MFRPHLRSGALAGVLAGLGVTGLLYLLSTLQLTSFVPLDVGNAVIELTPGQVTTTTIETIGEWGKRLVIVGGVTGFVLAFGGLGVLIAWLLSFRVSSSAGARRPLLIGALCALLPLALTLPIQYLFPANRSTLPDGLLPPLVLALVYALAGLAIAGMVAGLTARPPAEAAVPASLPRRAFLLGGATLLSLAAGSTVLAYLLPRRGPEGIGAQLPTPVPTPRGSEPANRSTATSTPAPTVEATEVPTSSGAVAAAETPAAASPPPATPTTLPSPTATSVPFAPAAGTRSEITEQDSLYVISSSTRDPQIDAKKWRLKIHGAVQTPYTLTYDELLVLPRHDQTSTMECISNEVGNLLIGNCNWNGVRLRDLLERAGVADGVVDVVLRAAEGYSESLPLAIALDPASMVAYGIDGQALSVKHGFPARIRVAGLYGEKNVKWLTEIELVKLDYKGYWQQRGWNDDATIFTTSVFDTGNPHLGNGQLKSENGLVALGGIAFAGSRGIRKVELQLDGGDWQEARLKEMPSELTWRLWRYDWTTSRGKHSLAVRAVDGPGELQTAEVQAPHPDGATGYHRIDVEVI